MDEYSPIVSLWSVLTVRFSLQGLTMKKTIIAVVKGFVWSSVFANFVEIFQSNNIKSVLNIVDVFTKIIIVYLLCCDHKAVVFMFCVFSIF